MRIEDIEAPFDESGELIGVSIVDASCCNKMDIDDDDYSDDE